MRASVVIITKNQKHILQKSLPVLLDQNFKGRYEVIVVDSGSTDGAREYVESLSVQLVKIKPKTFNFARAFNTGAKKAKGKYLVRLSGDVVPIGRNWLNEIIKPFRSSRVGGTYGRYTITRRKGYGYPDFWPAERFPKKLTRYSVKPTFLMGVNIFGYQFGDDKTRERVFDFAGGCCAVRKKIWQKRPFNESLLEGEDAEYAWFLHLIGYDIVCNPKARAIHEHKLSESKDKSFFASRGITKWQWIFNWQIIKYWLQRLIFIDPYKEIKIDSYSFKSNFNSSSKNRSKAA